MKLLVISQYFYPENFRINDLVNGLIERGHHVTVLTGQPNYPNGHFPPGYGWFGPRWEKISGADVMRVPVVARGSGRGIRLAMNYISFALFASLAAIFRVHGQYDAIFVFEPSPVTVGIPAYFARRRLRVPVFFWVLDLWPDSLSATGAVRSSNVLRLVEQLVRWIYKHCDRVLIQSQAFAQKIADLGVPPKHVKYFPNWIEVGYSARSAEDSGAAPAKSDGEFRVVFAGNIGFAQDFPAVLDAAEIIAETAPTVRWVIAGDGRMAGWLKDEVVKRGLQDRFSLLGQLSPDQMPSLFASAEALLVSLRSDPVFALTVPGKVQSYLASGRPLIAMLDGEGARVVKESGAGLVVDSGDATGLAEKVRVLVAMDKAQRDEMCRHGSEYAEHEFGREALFDKLESWLEEAVASAYGQRLKS